MNQFVVIIHFKLTGREDGPFTGDFEVVGWDASFYQFASQVPFKITELGGVPSGATINNMDFNHHCGG
jgi:hypothetical protein